MGRDRSEYQKEWYSKNKEAHLLRNKINHAKIKKAAFDHYGGKCACCGEDEIDFLAIDHIHNDGAEHRRSTNCSGSRMYSWLKNNDYPEGFQVLCHNCNFSKHLHGVCIHKL